MLFSVVDQLSGEISYKFDESILFPFPISNEEWGILWFRTDLKRVLIKIVCLGEGGFKVSLAFKTQISKIC